MSTAKLYSWIKQVCLPIIRERILIKRCYRMLSAHGDQSVDMFIELSTDLVTYLKHGGDVELVLESYLTHLEKIISYKSDVWVSDECIKKSALLSAIRNTHIARGAISV